MKFIVDVLPTINDTCPFENICCSVGTVDCPETWDDDSKSDDFKESVEARSTNRECEFLLEAKSGI